MKRLLTISIASAAIAIGAFPALAATAASLHRVFNIGNSQPTELLCFIEVMEQAFGRKSIKDFQKMQPGDVVATSADTSALKAWIDFAPSVPIEVGLNNFARWYMNFYV